MGPPLRRGDRSRGGKKKGGLFLTSPPSFCYCCCRRRATALFRTDGKEKKKCEERKVISTSLLPRGGIKKENEGGFLRWKKESLFFFGLRPVWSEAKEEWREPFLLLFHQGKESLDATRGPFLLSLPFFPMAAKNRTNGGREKKNIKKG